MSIDFRNREEATPTKAAPTKATRAATDAITVYTVAEVFTGATEREGKKKLPIRGGDRIVTDSYDVAARRIPIESPDV